MYTFDGYHFVNVLMFQIVLVVKPKYIFFLWLIQEEK